ncbi:ral guanine nucleotide dissociation stimulator-like isoform X2 [Orcinus orca]|uniref:ral guanine nucleotide dissociation stimulator-like isoform X2 n=1 Tax=Orcinus orca TaxID=9733 RepID=UPI002112B7FA|nr:ral guanine nucleotide dissociation stimulator-like isoform X2 [Orcinus orca]
MGRAGRTLDTTHLMVHAEDGGLRASPGKEERSPRELRTELGCPEEHPGGQRMSSILGTWLHHYTEHFHQPPEFPCLKMLPAYTELSMPGSDLEQQTHLLLAQLEHLEPPEAEGDAPAPEQALEIPQDLEPATLLLPTTAPEPEQAQATAPIQVQGLDHANMVAPIPETENAHAVAFI